MYYFVTVDFIDTILTLCDGTNNFDRDGSQSKTRNIMGPGPGPRTRTIFGLGPVLVLGPGPGPGPAVGHIPHEPK